MFELLELDPRFNTDAIDAHRSELSSRSPDSRRNTTAAVTNDEGHLSQGETLLLLAGLSSVVGSIWLTLTAIL